MWNIIYLRPGRYFLALRATILFDILIIEINVAERISFHKRWVSFKTNFTCSDRRSGRGGPGVTWDLSIDDCFQATWPSLPWVSLHPAMIKSKCQTSGFFCQSTKAPYSLFPFGLIPSSSIPAWNSEALIWIFPTAYMLSTDSSAACPPVAAMYWWIMYLAVDACFFKMQNEEVDWYVIIKQATIYWRNN